MFVALGMTATGIGRTLRSTAPACARSPASCFVMGVLFVAMLFVPLLNQEWRPE